MGQFPSFLCSSGSSVDSCKAAPSTGTRIGLQLEGTSYAEYLMKGTELKR